MAGWFILVSVAGLALGILSESLTFIGWPLIVFLALLAFVFLFFYLRARTRAYLISFVFLIAAALGAGRAALAPSSFPESFVPLIDTHVSLEGTIVADPDIRERTQRLTIETEQEGERTRVIAVTSRYEPFRFGERVQVQGVLELPEPFETDNGRTFRYDRFLAKDGVFGVIPFAEVEKIGEREGVVTNARGALSDFKFAGIDALTIALPEPHASLASGLILGGKQGLGESLLDDFITSGLIHIVVLSGYNVMIIADFIMRLFGAFSRRWAAGLGALTIAAFVLAAGAGPASIRAGIMALIALFGRATGRTYDAFRALLVAGVVMVLWSPLTLAYDPGFQLSFLATLGLIFGAPIVERWLSWVRPEFLRMIASSTIAAQIAVLPLLLYQNGLFSLIALPANLIVLPLVPFAMLFSALALVAGLIVPPLAPIIGIPAYALLSFIISTVEFSAALPLAAFTISEFPFILVLAAYALLAWLVQKLSQT